MRDRKKDHIELALKMLEETVKVDERFNYEPLLNAHPSEKDLSFDFLGKKMKVPIWISGMTGGTLLSEKININLAKACAEFGMGMGLGSCRSLIEDKTKIRQFDVRNIMGHDLPLYANLGIAQIEKLIRKKETEKIDELIFTLKADGLCVHINPLQEYFQPEGNLINHNPLQVVQELASLVKTNIIVKEVGQGMGPESLEALMKLPVSGIEFGAFGGTNFTDIELKRSDQFNREMFTPLVRVGHTAEEMLDHLNSLSQIFPHQKKQLIISGGIKSFLDGYYLLNKSILPAVYGQAAVILKYATEDYAALKQFIELQIKGIHLAYCYLRIRKK